MGTTRLLPYSPERVNMTQSASMTCLRPYSRQWRIWGHSQITLTSVQCSFHTLTLKIFLTKANLLWSRKIHTYLLSQLPRLYNQTISTKLLCIFFRETQLRDFPFLNQIKITLTDGRNKIKSQK